MRIPEQACAYEIAIASATLSRRQAGMSQVWSEEYSPRSRATFSPLSRNLEQPRREKARVSVVDRGTSTGKSRRNFLWVSCLGYPPPRSCLDDAILKCNVPPRARTTKAAYVYYALTTALLMLPAFGGKDSQDARILILRDLSVVFVLVSSDDFGCSRVLSLFQL